MPPLSEWNAITGPIDLGDWLALIEPMSDLTSTSGEWWQTLVAEACGSYQRHLQLQPLDRISHTRTPSPDLARSKWSQLEKRASTLLLMAVPEGQREDLISSKRLTALGIICQLLVIYQPGGLAEKELILRSLEQHGDDESSRSCSITSQLDEVEEKGIRPQDLRAGPFHLAERPQQDHPEAPGRSQRPELQDQPCSIHFAGGCNSNFVLNHFIRSAPLG